jgi:hypothetical protein
MARVMVVLHGMDMIYMYRARQAIIALDRGDLGVYGLVWSGLVSDGLGYPFSFLSCNERSAAFGIFIFYFPYSLFLFMFYISRPCAAAFCTALHRDLYACYCYRSYIVHCITSIHIFIMRLARKERVYRGGGGRGACLYRIVDIYLVLYRCDFAQ